MNRMRWYRMGDEADETRFWTRPDARSMSMRDAHGRRTLPRRDQGRRYRGTTSLTPVARGHPLRKCVVLPLRMLLATTRIVITVRIRGRR